jgi:hypothetical protein
LAREEVLLPVIYFLLDDNGANDKIREMEEQLI